GMSHRRIITDKIVRHLLSFIGGIVQHLDVELAFWVLQTADGIDQAPYHVLFIEDGQLNGDPRQFSKVLWRLRRALLAVLVIKVNQDVSVNAVRGEQNQDNKIRDEQRHIEGVGVI